MSNAGHPDSPEPPQSVNPATSRRRWLVLLFLVVAVLLGAVVALQVMGVLTAMISPPSIPLPDNLEEVSHDNPEYGVDSWVYNSEQNACQLLRFYVDQGADCVWAYGDVCEGEELWEFLYGNQRVADCSGEVMFSIFAMRWDVTLTTGFSQREHTRMNVSREIFWTGQIPPTAYPRPLEIPPTENSQSTP